MEHLLIARAGGHGRSVTATALETGAFDSLYSIDAAADKVKEVWGPPAWSTVSEQLQDLQLLVF